MFVEEKSSGVARGGGDGGGKIGDMPKKLEREKYFEA